MQLLSADLCPKAGFDEGIADQEDALNLTPDENGKSTTH
jgi:hypothetical protein